MRKLQRDLIMEKHFTRLYERLQAARLRDAVEQEMVKRTVGQQTVQTGLFPAPKFIRRLAHAL